MKLTVVKPDVSGLTINQWAKVIKQNMAEAVGGLIDAGLHLENAVEDFKQQDNVHWKHAYSELLRQVNVSRSMAHRLRAIAANKAFHDRGIQHHLPQSWTTLAELARLPPDEIMRLVSSGEVTPELRGKDVLQWLPSNRAKSHGSSDTEEAYAEWIKEHEEPDDSQPPTTPVRAVTIERSEEIATPVRVVTIERSEQATTPQAPPSRAFRHSQEAINCLGKIRPDDPNRAEALQSVIDWINFNH